MDEKISRRTLLTTAAVAAAAITLAAPVTAAESPAPVIETQDETREDYWIGGY